MTKWSTEQAVVSDIKDCLYFKNDEDIPNAIGEESILGLVEAKCSGFNIISIFEWMN